ncbi:uncharacterized protein LOC111899570 [Lactuca sativa]|uniref:CCHC-type domain-containing protein n=1 Tax=Lactuca sativa TaxID=4236 RepID=A0A9R1VGE7_LACSA|nr:uncharacterized protein LOC111899570 [Lactuca sativa]KAJ0205715.1 hypothetical protein LSAT_V11C500267800 [Lactuca sativa]
MLEKTYSTFHATNITLMQQYRLQKLTKYSELNACLLVAEQNNELLMKNHEFRPTISVALLEANATNTDGYRNYTCGRGRGCGLGRGRGYLNRNQSHNHNHNFGRGQGNNRGRGQKRNNCQYLQRNNIHSQEKAKVARHDVGTSQKSFGSCYRCGSTGHLSRTYHTPAHLYQLYRESIKGKGKEVNLIDNVECTPLTVADFCNDMEDIN